MQESITRLVCNCPICKRQRITVLDVGCGNNKVDGAIGIDKFKLPVVDIICDISKEKLPFKTSSVDVVHANHVLEHIEYIDFPHTLKEIYRVLKPNGAFFVRVPHWRGMFAWGNMDHKRVFSPVTFYQLSSKNGEHYYYNYVDFEIVSIKYNFFLRGNRWFFLNPFFSFFNNNMSMQLHEKVYSIFMPPEEMLVELMCKK